MQKLWQFPFSSLPPSKVNEQDVIYGVVSKTGNRRTDVFGTKSIDEYDLGDNVGMLPIFLSISPSAIVSFSVDPTLFEIGIYSHGERGEHLAKQKI